jgi:uncharacterized phiE125 gp8 family phage protein
VKYKILTQPATEPITLTEAKLHLRVSNTLENDLITSLIVAARKWVENFTWRPLITQTWTLFFDFSDVQEIKDRTINISKNPVQTISSVKYYDSTNTLVTLNSSNYYTNLGGDIAIINFINPLPTIYNRIDALQIEFVCGYGNAASVPDNIKSAIYLTLTSLYDNRDGKELIKTQDAAEHLLAYDTNRHFRI